MPKSRWVAVMLDIESAYNWHTSIYAGAQTYAKEQGWRMVIDEYADDTLPTKRNKPIPYDGVIARATKKLAERGARLNVPIVNVWRNSPAHGQLPGVFPDFSAIGRMRAEHLLTRGFCRFAAVMANNIPQNMELKAFCLAIHEAGYSCNFVRVSARPTASLSNWRKTERVISDLLENSQTPLGVYLGSEADARMMIQICDSRGLRVPEDVAIIAGWNEETLCGQPHPTITSVEVGGERAGYEAARMLHRLMDGKSLREAHVLLPAQSLIARESTDVFAVEDELVASALAFIASNSHRRIGQHDVSKAVKTETRTLQNRFRKILDRPIATEIRRVRIERAKRELTQSKRSLTDIARSVGFGETMRMYEVFRRELGVTPSEYRKQRQIEKEIPDMS